MVMAGSRRSGGGGGGIRDPTGNEWKGGTVVI